MLAGLCLLWKYDWYALHGVKDMKPL